jgi:hypothetical protein
MATINALLNANIFTSWRIAVGWITEQKRQERFTLVDLYVPGATSQSVELSKARRKILPDTSRWKMLQQKHMLIRKWLNTNRCKILATIALKLQIISERHPIMGSTH